MASFWKRLLSALAYDGDPEPSPSVTLPLDDIPRVVSLTQLHGNVYEVVTESARYGRVTQSVLLMPHDSDPAPPQRTKSQVAVERGAVVGCCNRHADNMGCDCLKDAADDRRPRALEEYDRTHDNGCSICRDPNCSDPCGKH